MLVEIQTDTRQGVRSQDPSHHKLERTCAEFESIFLTYMLKTMRSAIGAKGPLGNTNESKMIKSMFDENIALGIARGGGIGLGKALYEKLSFLNEKRLF
jgi:flagellar protein FlgJ